MPYKRKISSLEDKAAVQVAISLCQENDFKEVAMCLEKPTYGAFIRSNQYLAFDPEILSEWDKIKHIDWQCSIFLKSYYPDSIKRFKQWDRAVDEQSQQYIKKLPYSLKDRVEMWIKRIALEYLSYCQRLEVLFGVSRYFLMNILNRGDWMEAARLNEVKLAVRLVKDERLTVLTRYRIACTYCLGENIFSLEKQLSSEEQHCLYSNKQSSLCREMVLSWSYYVRRQQDERIMRKKKRIWISMVENAVRYGNRESLMLYWKELEENTRHDIVIDMALKSLEKWQSILIGLYTHDWKERLFLHALPYSYFEFEYSNLPSYYTELVFFFLSEMHEEQQLIFFKKAFKSDSCRSVLDCFLDWPHQDDFLPIVNYILKIVPKNKYEQCLLDLASKYSGSYYEKHSCSLLYKKENFYDYQSLLWRLWEETPEEYKQYVFCEKPVKCCFEHLINEGRMLFLRLLERSPFLEKDKALFKRVLQDLPKGERIVMMFSKVGEEMCCTLTQKGNLSLVDWLLEECVPKEKIPSCKKQFIQSDCGRRLCFYKLKENCEKLLEDLIDWSLELDTEKTQFKCKLVDGDDCLDACKCLLSNGKFTEVDRMINYCLSSEELKKQFKRRLTKLTCNVLLQDLALEQIDKIFSWCCDTDEEIRDIKRNLFSDEGVNTHYKLMFSECENEWKGVEYFYKWFSLSPAEIKNIKKETIFHPECIKEICDDIQDETDFSLEPLRRCVADEEMMISLKKVVHEECSRFFYYQEERARKHFDYLVSELISSLRKEDVYDQTRQESDMKDKGDKRSSIVIENESSLPSKRFK